MARKLVVTGAAGFVGKKLVQALLERGDRVIAIDRNPPPAKMAAEIHWIQADLNQAEKYRDALENATVVYHLAAVTGKARPEAYTNSNVQATKVCLDQCGRARVGHFVFLSTVAVSYEDRRFYPYAESKIAAEAAVCEAAFHTTIVRPTMIMGAGSPIEASLRRLAGMPVIPIFGAGKVRVQPVDVMEVVQLLCALGEDSGCFGATLEIGGPKTLTMEELLLELRAQTGKTPARVVHLPLKPLRQLLAIVEKPLLPILPFTAGQLAAFANGSLAAPSPQIARLLNKPDAMPSVDDMARGPSSGTTA